MPRISHILETALYVADLGRAAGFYTRVFGFETLLADHRMVSLAVPGGGLLLLFGRGLSTEPGRVPGGLIPAHDADGHQHLCFAIPLAELDAWERHLAAEGVPVESRVVQAFGGTSLYFRDPDGNSIEIATAGLWPNA